MVRPPGRAPPPAVEVGGVPGGVLRPPDRQSPPPSRSTGEDEVPGGVPRPPGREPPPQSLRPTTEEQPRPDVSTERADRLETTTDGEENTDTSTERQDTFSITTEQQSSSESSTSEKNEPTTTETQNSRGKTTDRSDELESKNTDGRDDAHSVGGLTTSATSNAELDGQESIAKQISVTGDTAHRPTASGGEGTTDRTHIPGQRRPGETDGPRTVQNRVTSTAKGIDTVVRPSVSNVHRTNTNRLTTNTGQSPRHQTTDSSATEQSTAGAPPPGPPPREVVAPGSPPAVSQRPPLVAHTPRVSAPSPPPPAAPADPDAPVPGSLEAPARVVALLGIHGPGRRVCGGAVSAEGLQRWEALRWTVTRLSRRLRLHVRLEPADHCGSPMRAVRLLSVGPPPLAVIHDLPGAAAGAVTAALAGANVTVLRLSAGEGAAPPAEFSVQPPPGWQPALLATLVRALGLRRLLVLHSDEPRRRALAAALSAQLRPTVPCLRTATLGPSLGGLSAAADSTHGRAILALLQPADMDLLFKQLAARPGRRDPLFFVGDASWGDNIRLLRRHSLVVDNAVIVRARRLDVAAFGEQFLQTRGAAGGGGGPSAGWRAQYWRQCGARCSLETAGVEDALLTANSLMAALARLQRTECEDPPREDATCQPIPRISGGLAGALLAGPDSRTPAGLPVLSFDSDRWAVRRADVLNLRDMRRIPTVREMHYVKVGEVDASRAYLSRPVVANTADGREVAAASWIQGSASSTESGGRRGADWAWEPPPPLPERHLPAAGGSLWYLALSVDAHGRGGGALGCGRPRAAALTALDWAAAALERSWRRRPRHRPGLLLVDGCQQPLRRQQQAAGVAAAFRRHRVPSVVAAAGGGEGRLSLSADPQTTAAALGRLLEQLQWRLVSLVHAPHSAWHAAVLAELTAGPRPPRLAVTEALSAEPGGGQLAAAAAALAAGRQRGAHVLITLLPAPVTGQLLSTLRQHGVRLFVISVDLSRRGEANYSGTAGAVRMVPPPPPPAPGSAPATVLTADLWPEAGAAAGRGDRGRELDGGRDGGDRRSAPTCCLYWTPSAQTAECDLSTLDAFDADDLTRHVESLWVDPGSDEGAYWQPVGNCTVQNGLQLELEQLVAYRTDGEPVPAAEVRSTCPSCQPPPDQTHIMEVALAGSSYQLAVLAPVHREGADMFRCGPLADTETLLGVAAAAWSVAASRLPVGARVLDTCGRPERARDQLFSLLSSAAADPRRLLGVLSLSEPAGAAVAGMLRQAGVPHVWLPLTGHGGAYDRMVGPYRAVPPVELEVHAVVSLARRFGWRYLSVLHSTDQYGLWARQLLVETAPQHDICVGSVIGVGGGFGAAEAEGALAELGRDSAASTVVVLVSRAEQTRRLLAAAAAAEDGLRERLLFVVGRHGGPPPDDERLAPALRRAVFVSLPESPPMTAVSRWLATMSADSHAPLPDEWFAELAERRRQCAEAAADGQPASADCAALPREQSPPPVSAYVHQASAAVAALLDTLSQYLQRHCVPGQPCAQLVGAELMEALDARLANTSSSTPQRPRLLSAELQLWAVPDGRRPRPLASYGRGLLRLAQGEAGWRAALEQHRSECSTGPCLATCAQQTELLAPRAGGPPPEPEPAALRSVFGVVSVVLSALGVLVALGCLAYFSLSASSRVCRSPVDAQVLVGLILICCDNVAFLLPASAGVCGARRFVTGLAYATVYSALLVKMIQVWRVAGGRCDELSQRGALLLVSLCLLAVQALLGAAWLVLSPPRAQTLVGRLRCAPAGRFEAELAVSLIYVLLLKLGLVCFCAAGWRGESASGGREPEPRWLLATAGLTGAAWAGWLAAVLSWPAEHSACHRHRHLQPGLRLRLLRLPLPEEENARTWNPATEENGASLSFADDESVDLDRSLSVHEFTLSAEQRSRITAAACLHVTRQLSRDSAAAAGGARLGVEGGAVAVGSGRDGRITPDMPPDELNRYFVEVGPRVSCEETVTSSSESEDMDHYDTPKALNELVRRLGDRTVLVLPTDNADGQDEDSKI
ncbi:Metabotropic glutamate receptor 2 [Amphibalanus amphitrite]|uniref:Metabotropic glutamate receptor 2 n=1 Tax=Amphibalanus amphitrite TaxID=1232801 RepID=A0A6A4X1R2_AMPAM|nr:Metabotropic glutamate receptor 2 [Amphibalanus amphitrite]